LRRVLSQMVPRGLVMVIVAILAAHYPFIQNVAVESITRHAGVWTVDGTITVDKTQLADEWTMMRPEGYSWYNHEGMLQWWEQHINDVLSESRFGFVHVVDLDLEWLEIGETYDIITYHAVIRLGKGRHK
jgi:hypothetical protein